LLRSREIVISPPVPSTLGRRSIDCLSALCRRGQGDACAGEQRRRAAVLLRQERCEQVLRLDEAVVVAEREALGVVECLLELGCELVEAHGASS
jgi:hypothetical protein